MIYVLDLGTARKYQVKNWSSDQGLCHILSLACCGKVVKKNGNIYMTHKAFNGRIIVEYLANACSLRPGQFLEMAAVWGFGFKSRSRQTIPGGQMHRIQSWDLLPNAC